MMFIIRLLLLFLISVPALAQTRNAENPRLIVTIMVDPLSPQWLDHYGEYLGPGGMRKLQNQGFTFSQAYVNQFLANRASSVASLSTGAPAALNGIVGVSWYDRLRKSEVYCTEDYQSSDFVNFIQGRRHSSHQLLVTTLADQIIRYTEGRVISVSMEPDAAILGGGHYNSGSFWFDPQSGGYTSNSRFMDQLPQWVIDFNNQNHGEQILGKDWDILSGKTMYPKAMPDNNPYELGIFGNFTSFPYRLNRMKKNTTDGVYELIKHTPFGNSLLTDFAISALHNEKLGQDDQTDLLTITYTAFNKIIMMYGPDSQEAVDAIVRLDLEIQHLLYVLEELIGKENVIVVFTATHGSGWNVDHALAQKLPAGKFRVRNAIALLNSYLSAIYGENYWIESYINQQIYLDQTLIDKNKIPIAEIQEQAARFLTQFQGVANAYTATQLNALQISETSESSLIKAFHMKRSGDILLNLQPGWIQDGNFVSDHLSDYTYDQHIPLIFWGGGTEHGKNSSRVSLLNIAPTLSDLCNLPYPSGSTAPSITELLLITKEK